MLQADIDWVTHVIGQSSLCLLPNAPRGDANRRDASLVIVQKANQLLNGDNQGVYILNPSPQINTSGIGAPNTLGLRQKYPDRLNLEIAKDKWLNWGAGYASRTNCKAFSGYCTGFASVLIAIFVSKNSSLPSTTRVERFNSGTADTGHTYTVLDRALVSTENDPNTWGAGCVVVDPWYGLQTDTDAVKQIGSQLDAAYFNALTIWGNIWLAASYTVGERTIPIKLP